MRTISFRRRPRHFILPSFAELSVPMVRPSGIKYFRRFAGRLPQLPRRGKQLIVDSGSALAAGSEPGSGNGLAAIHPQCQRVFQIRCPGGAGRINPADGLGIQNLVLHGSVRDPDRARPKAGRNPVVGKGGRKSIHLLPWITSFDTRRRCQKKQVRDTAPRHILIRPQAGPLERNHDQGKHGTAIRHGPCAARLLGLLRNLGRVEPRFHHPNISVRASLVAFDVSDYEEFVYSPVEPRRTASCIHTDWACPRCL